MKGHVVCVQLFVSSCYRLLVLLINDLFDRRHNVHTEVRSITRMWGHVICVCFITSYNIVLDLTYPYVVTSIKDSDDWGGVSWNSTVQPPMCGIRPPLTPTCSVNDDQLLYNSRLRPPHPFDYRHPICIMIALYWSVRLFFSWSDLRDFYIAYIIGTQQRNWNKRKGQYPSPITTTCNALFQFMNAEHAEPGIIALIIDYAFEYDWFLICNRGRSSQFITVSPRRLSDVKNRYFLPVDRTIANERYNGIVFHEGRFMWLWHFHIRCNHAIGACLELSSRLARVDEHMVTLSSYKPHIQYRACNVYKHVNRRGHTKVRVDQYRSLIGPYTVDMKYDVKECDGVDCDKKQRTCVKFYMPITPLGTESCSVFEE